jgi:ubiquinone/menaquinone biosynthesis C-methylase UbiE/uncharacterized protein YbaR (Trm112 family)
MSMNECTSANSLIFVCPKCRCPLRSEDNALHCSNCIRRYPITTGIPDFIAEDSLARLASVSRIAKFMDLVAPIYESRFWQQLNLRLAGANNTSLRSLANFHSRSLENITGIILDVACGPATYGRRIASPTRSVYGIDISMGVLQKGKAYAKRENITGVHLARARAEKLPFDNAVFDGAICSGSLHLFPDTVLSLREMARTMKPGSPLSVQTFIEGNTIVNRMLKKQTWVHNFKLAELQQYLTEAGFEGFQWKLDGPIVITFSAHKTPSNH